MKTLVISLMLVALYGNPMTAQPLPADSLYLGQVPPGNIPKIFSLPVDSGSFAAERIAISNDNREIYYTGIRRYYPVTGDTIKYYAYSGDKWNGPFNLFNGYLAPALSRTGDTLFFQSNSLGYESYYTVRNNMNWSDPRRFLLTLNSAHYLQETNNGHCYISSIPASGTGGADWCMLDIQTPDTTAISLGLPVNTGVDNLDFFVSRDESFMILAKSGLRISYHKDDGSWTNPKSLGPQINFGLGMWGPFVSADNKYLFYSTGTHADYSDVHIYWVRIDHLMDSLMHTNYVPYLKNPIPQQNTAVGHMFDYTVTDSTFIDDDGNNTLTYAARLTNGNPLPDWLTFDTITAIFSGRPQQIQQLNIRITATDNAGESVNTTFKIQVGDTAAIHSIKDMGLRIFPNPTRDLLHISLEVSNGRPVLAEIINMEGKPILQSEFSSECCFDLSNVPKGIYILKAIVNDEPLIRRICVY